MKWLLIWCGVSCALGALWALLNWRSEDELQALDAEWLAEQARDEQARGIDGPCWSWPIDKSLTERRRA